MTIARYQNLRLLKLRFVDNFLKLIGSNKIARMRVQEKASRQKKSVCVFTTHKAASSGINRLIRKLIRENYNLIDYADAIFHENRRLNIQDYEEFLSQHSDALFLEYGEIYSPLRRPFVQKSVGRAIFVLRDPRDVLISEFYSYRDSHSPPTSKNKLQKFNERQALLNNMTLDSYVLDRATELNALLDEYSQIKSQMNDSVILYYNEFRNNKVDFAKKLAAFLNLQNSAEYITKCCKDPIVFRKSNHLRDGSNSQYLQLQTATQKKLNDIFHQNLLYWGFDV